MSEELMKALESAKTEDQKKAVMEKYKDELRNLSDDELKGVSGGVFVGWTPGKDGGPKASETPLDFVLGGLDPWKK